MVNKKRRELGVLRPVALSWEKAPFECESRRNAICLRIAPESAFCERGAPERANFKRLAPFAPQLSTTRHLRASLASTTTTTAATATTALANTLPGSRLVRALPAMGGSTGSARRTALT